MPAPGVRSATSVVPAAVPSLRHSSVPLLPSLAPKGMARVVLPVAVNADSLATWFAPALAAFAADAPVLVCTAEVLANLNEKYGLDQPLWKQVLIYLKGLLFHFDFGVSFKYKDRTVNDIIA